MDWSNQQDAALVEVEEWRKDESAPQVKYMAGYAGTGKTTMAKHLASGVDGTVLFGAFTGKAAHVLRQKGCAGATTIHAMMYKVLDKGTSRLKAMQEKLSALQSQLTAMGPDPLEGTADMWKRLASPHGKLREEIRVLAEQITAELTSLKRPSFQLNPEGPIKYADMVVIDECSMVDESMGRDLESFGKKILVLGDPAQLPPVGAAGYFTNRRPDILLTEVHRQAKGSPILWLATQVREGRGLPPPGRIGEDCIILPSGATGLAELAMEADQILVGRNTTRHASNKRVRSIQGRGESIMPVGGDKLVCLRNNSEMGLLNGSLWRVHEASVPQEDYILLSISSEEDGPVGLDVVAHTSHFLGTENTMKWYDRRKADEFDFGYALTVHKSQGSQWDSVMLFDESGAFRENRAQWLYTGITRAARALTVVR